MNSQDERRSHLETPSDLGLGWDPDEASEPRRVIHLSFFDVVGVLCIASLSAIATVGFLAVVGGQ